MIFTSTVLCCAALWWNKLYIRLFWKRNFKKAEKDDKDYGAKLVYHFPARTDEQTETTSIVDDTKKALTELAFKVFDPCQETLEPGQRAMEQINDLTTTSHRCIILLTSQYQTNDWENFFKGFKDDTEPQSGFIFVLSDGVKQYIKRKANSGDKDFTTMRATLQASTSIRWSPKRKFSYKNFRHEMELAMPKLKKAEPRQTSTNESIE